MNIIIAGGRDMRLPAEALEALTALHAQYHFSLVVHGGYRGVDQDADLWARGQGIPVKMFPAKWAQEGRAAGPIRNRAMAEYVGAAGMLIAFPGGKGTEDMRRQASRVGMRIVEGSQFLVSLGSAGKEA